MEQAANKVIDKEGANRLFIRRIFPTHTIARL